MRRFMLVLALLTCAFTVEAEVRTVSFEDMVSYHVRLTARQEIAPPAGRNCVSVTNVCGVVRLVDETCNLPLGIHRLQFRDADGWLELRDATNALECVFAPTSSTPVDWVRTLYGRVDDDDPCWDLSYIVTEWQLVPEGYIEPMPSKVRQNRAPVASSLETNLHFTAFSISGGRLNYALAWPPSVQPRDGILDVYGTRDLVGGLWSIVDTFSTAGIQAYSNSLPFTAIPGWCPATPAPHDASCHMTTNIVEDPFFSDTAYTNAQWNCDHRATSEPPGFLFAADRADDDGYSFADAWADRLYALDGDSDGVPDIEEKGFSELLSDEGFLWFEISDGINDISQNSESCNVWSSLYFAHRYGERTCDFAQMCLDGFLNLVPDVNWPQGQIASWESANDLLTTDYSRGGLTMMAMPADLRGRVMWGSGTYYDCVVTNGLSYDVFEWKNVGAASGDSPQATFEVILPAAEPDVVYMSYLSVDEGFPVAGCRFGVQDAARRSASNPSEFYAVTRLGTSEFPRSRQTVKFSLGRNTDVRSRNDYVAPVLSSTACTNAYYTVLVRATAGTAAVTFTGDGPSNLPDPHFLLGAGREARVLLLKGKSYSVSSTAPVSCSDPSETDVVVSCLDGERKSWRVERPVSFSLVDDSESGSDEGWRVVGNLPELICDFNWTGVCRPAVGADGVWRLNCIACGCGRCRITGTATWEGYTKALDLGFCHCLPEGEDEQTEISCPDTIFNNDDSDRIEGMIDAALRADSGAGDNPLKDDDVVPVTITFGVANSRGSAVIRASGGKLRFWDSKEKRNEVRLPKWLDDVELPCTVELWMEATDVSSAYEDQSITLSWQSASGRHSGNLVKKITAVETVIEPICAEEKVIGEDKYIYNPSCLVNDGRGAWFKVSWTPEDYPASRVTWSNDNAGIRFLGGNTGAEVCVWTTASAGAYARLSVQFGDCPSIKPSTSCLIVEPKLIRVYIVPVVEKEFDTVPALYEEERRLAQELYAQCGITFAYILRPPYPFAGVYNIRRLSPSSRQGLSLADELVDGLIVYISPGRFSDSSAFTFRRGGRELILGRDRHMVTLAHEIGHTFGLRDIYVKSTMSPDFHGTGMIHEITDDASSRLLQSDYDWNNGSGQRYYSLGEKHHELIGRLLMNGSGRGRVRADIPMSQVYGVGRFLGGFQIRMVNVGVEDMEIPSEIIIPITERKSGE